MRHPHMCARANRRLSFSPVTLRRVLPPSQFTSRSRASLFITFYFYYSVLLFFAFFFLCVLPLVGALLWKAARRRAAEVMQGSEHDLLISRLTASLRFTFNKQ